jgi:hypothetical protein
LLDKIVCYDDEICQMDVKIVFLKGSLLEDMYVTQPEIHKDFL